MKRTNEEMLMRILSNGGTVEHDGQKWRMALNGSLLVEYGEGFVMVDCSMSGFKSMADSIGRDELWLKCCAMSLAEKGAGNGV